MDKIKVRVLVVDDENIICNLLTDILTDESYQTIVARTGEEAIEYLNKETFHAAFIDIKLPGKNGIEILKEARKIDPSLAVIMITAYATIQTAKMAMQLGAHDYITKPIDPDEILESLRKGLEKRHLELKMRGADDKPSILVVDDEESICTLLKDTLGDEGYLVKSATDPVNALEMIKEGDFNILLADIKMPGMDGLELLSKSRQVNPELLVILITGYPSIENVIEAMKKDACDYITKPIDPDEVLSSIIKGWERQRMVLKNKWLLRKLEDSNEKLHRTNKELREMQGYLIQSIKMATIGELGTAIAHRLNQPLGAIKGFAQHALEKIPSDNPLRKNLENIDQQSTRAAQMVKDLLEFARRAMQNGVYPQSLDINNVIEQTISFIQEELRLKNIKVNLNLSKDMPKVLGVATELQQIFLNLITNASESMPNGGALSILTEAANDFLKISFVDKGMGISNEHINQIFDPFFTTKDNALVSGIGLSSTRIIVTKHSGFIEVWSVKGKGTTVSVFLPIAGAKSCWEIINCKDCPAGVSQNEKECFIYQNRLGHRCWAELGKEHYKKKDQWLPECQRCRVYMQKTITNPQLPDQSSYIRI